MNRKQRDANRDTAEKLWRKVHKPKPCPNCGEPGAHFCPPSFGEPGFFSCAKNVRLGSEAQ